MRRFIFIGLTILATAVTASAQQPLHLPSSHASQHQQLIANQRPAAAAARTDANRRAERDLRQREDLNDIFTNNWNSEHVNPYGSSVEIPATKDIDVRGFVMPVDRYTVSSRYGYRPKFRRMHRGIDLTLNVGDTVRSAFDGKVRLCKYEGRGYGYYVVVRHNNGMETVYGHLSKFLVQPNQTVRAGQPIALGGNTGRSTGPHLHFETRYLGLALNPEGLIDFDNKTTHKDFYAFNKSTYEQSQNYAPSNNNRQGRVIASSGRNRNSSSSRRRSSRRR